MTAKIFKINNNFNFEINKIFSIFNSTKPDSIRLVGGCVRDLIIKKSVKDFDFATKFLPEEVIKILQKNNVKAIPTGLKYGTITAIINDKSFEITTLRQDVENDGRHPKAEFVDDYFLDAKRRDFTINALYLDESGKIYDYFNGFEDLKNAEVKFIGDANLRIEEDYLRIIRFFRFSISYSKTLDNQGLEACIKNKNGLKKLSADRIRNEFFKFFETKNNKNLISILEIFEKNIRSEIFNNGFQIKNLEKLLNIADNFSNNLKFATLILPSKSSLEEVFVKMNFSNIDKKYFSFLNHNLSQNNLSLKEFLVFYERDFVKDLFILKYILQNIEQEKILQNIDFIDNFNIPQFPIAGQDLLELNFSGKIIGEILLNLKKIWIEKNFQLDKNELLEIVKKIYNAN